MRRFLGFAFMLVVALSLYSVMPTLFLYLEKNPIPRLNEEATGKLKTNTGDYFQFIVFGDNHAGLILNDSATLKMIKWINREDRFKKVPIDFAMITGDITLCGSEWDYAIFNKLRSLIKFPVISAIGNHDDDNAGLKRFDKFVGVKNFAFRNRNSYFIVIDNIEGDMPEERFRFLERELEKSLSYAHRFVIAHKAPMSPYQQSWYRPELSGWSYRFMKLCEKHKVDIVFSGHEHMFKETALGGVKYIVSGAGGIITHVPTPEGGFLHYLVVRVYGDYIDYEVRSILPPIWEFFAYYIWKDAFYFLKALFLQ